MVNYEFDLNSMPNELKLLLLILRSESDSNQALRSLKNASNIDWNYFIELAQHHRVYPVIYEYLKSIESDLVPERVRSKLHDLYTRNLFQMLSLSGELILISNMFRVNRIRWLVLKGPVLAELLYGDISLRTSKDLDIIISHTDIDNVRAALEQAGYVQQDETGSSAFTRLKEHHLTFMHPQKRIQLEIHWRLNWSVWGEPSFDQMWERRDKIQFKGTSINVLSPEDLFFSLVTHGTRHGWFRLRWLYDMDRLVKKDLNWDKIIQIMNEYKMPYLGAQVLLLLFWMFNRPVSEKIALFKPNKKAYILAQMSAGLIQGKNVRRYTLWILNFTGKIAYVLDYFHPKPWDINTLPLPRMLKFLYIPLRPVLYVWRSYKRQRVTKEH
ncbi:nucleotidyltransferase family protein [Paenibacillus lycopersici]|uniref:Nucleotidyltransferase family protein n=1 Tax=Paenibacillus lycopersici TaxID=2704462 RepID=A0A6C0FRZ2_9BACL|nr:nucleotidyltransferase family protein [Paenibacillus lycopersici]QHT59908.1 nucleotidyltransferase family protein [Paenibacillus lycopersici]